MIWVLIAVLGMFSGFALHQLVKNVRANRLLRKASPLHLGFAVDKLASCCNAYVKLLSDANRLFGVQTTTTVFAINSHLIYSVACLRSIITSLSAVYLMPGHAEYQIVMLKYWINEIYPQHKIITDYSKDTSMVEDLKKEGTKDLVNQWAAIAAVVSTELQIIYDYITDGMHGGKC